MPLSASGLSAVIQTELNAGLPITDVTKTQDFADAIAAAIVSYLLANLTVNTVIPSGSSAGSYPGVVS